MDIGSIHFHMCCVSILGTWDALFHKLCKIVVKIFKGN